MTETECLMHLKFERPSLHFRRVTFPSAPNSFENMQNNVQKKVASGSSNRSPRI